MYVILSVYRVHGELEEKRREAEVASAEVLSLNSQLSHSQASVRVTKSVPLSSCGVIGFTDSPCTAIEGQVRRASGTSAES